MGLLLRILTLPLAMIGMTLFYIASVLSNKECHYRTTDGIEDNWIKIWLR